MRHPVQSAIIRLRRELGITQQQLAVDLGKAVVTVARWETSRLPSPEELAALIQYAVDKKQDAIASELALGFLAILPLHKLTRGFAAFERKEQGADIAGHMLVVVRGAEQARAAMAFFEAFMDLASREQSRKKKAAAALRPLLKAYLESAEGGEK